MAERLDLSDRFLAALLAIDRRRRFGAMAVAAGMVVLEHHRPEVTHLTDGSTKIECAGHFGSNEEQHPWPCDEVKALAHAWGVAL